MSTILNELVKIREKLDSDGTYSGSTAGVPETVTQIRELVENDAGSGGGPKTYNIVRKNNKVVIEASAGELRAGDICVLTTEDGPYVESDAQIVLSSTTAFDGYAVTITVNTDDLQGTPFEALEWVYSAEDGGYIIGSIEPNS